MITDDEEHIVLRKLRDGDTEALDMLYLRYAARVCEFAYRLLGNRSEAEDITHDVFLKVWEQRKALVCVLSFKAYLFRMTRNAVFNLFKSRQVACRYRNRKPERNEAPVPPDECVSTEELIELIDLTIRKMPEQRRRVFCMSRFEDMSYNDIAQALDISPKTVQYHISTALAELRKLLSAMAFFV